MAPATILMGILITLASLAVIAIVFISVDLVYYETVVLPREAKIAEQNRTRSDKEDSAAGNFFEEFHVGEFEIHYQGLHRHPNQTEEEL